MLLHAVVLAAGQFMIDEFYEAFQGLFTAHIVVSDIGFLPAHYPRVPATRDICRP